MDRVEGVALLNVIFMVSVLLSGRTAVVQQGGAEVEAGDGHAIGIALVHGIDLRSCLTFQRTHSDHVDLVGVGSDVELLLGVVIETGLDDQAHAVAEDVDVGSAVGGYRSELERWSRAQQGDREGRRRVDAVPSDVALGAQCLWLQRLKPRRWHRCPRC